MKGGVGKSTTAVNLSYLAAASGMRTLLWDLDAQAASSFAFRVRPSVSGFNKSSLEDGAALAAAIKETDYHGLHLLPADFAYRKFERFLSSLGNPERLIHSLLDTLGRDFDLVFLDCPPGFSLLTEGIFASTDVILVPTLPTVLSLRMVLRLLKWAHGADSPVRLAAFFNLVDRRKTLHRRALEWALRNQTDPFLNGQVPYSSIVEQMAARRVPLAEFAPRELATRAFGEVWAELQTCLEGQDVREPRKVDWLRMRKAVELLIAHLEPVEHEVLQTPQLGPHTARGS